MVFCCARQKMFYLFIYLSICPQTLTLANNYLRLWRFILYKNLKPPLEAMHLSQPQLFSPSAWEATESTLLPSLPTLIYLPWRPSRRFAISSPFSFSWSSTKGLAHFTDRKKPESQVKNWNSYFNETFFFLQI